MEYKRYYGVCRYSRRTRMMSGRVINAGDASITFRFKMPSDGTPTAKSAGRIWARFEAAVDRYLAACTREGREPEPPRRWRLEYPPLRQRPCREEFCAFLLSRPALISECIELPGGGHASVLNPMIIGVAEEDELGLVKAARAKARAKRAAPRRARRKK